MRIKRAGILLGIVVCLPLMARAGEEEQAKSASGLPFAEAGAQERDSVGEAPAVAAGGYRTQAQALSAFTAQAASLGKKIPAPGGMPKEENSEARRRKARTILSGALAGVGMGLVIGAAGGPGTMAATVVLGASAGAAVSLAYVLKDENGGGSGGGKDQLIGTAVAGAGVGIIAGAVVGMGNPAVVLAGAGIGAAAGAGFTAIFIDVGGSKAQRDAAAKIDLAARGGR